MDTLFLQNDASPSRFPTGNPPLTWAMDQAFRDIVSRYEQWWLERGYRFKFGIELNCRLMKPGCAEAALQDAYPGKTLDDIRGIHPEAKDVLEACDQIRASGPVLSPADMGRAVLDYLQRCRSTCTADEIQTINHREEIVHGLLSRLNARDLTIKDAAEADLLLAFIHAMPEAEGGLADIIEPRFGTRRLGQKGWYDFHDDIEIRPWKLLDPHEAITWQHTMIGRISRLAVACGFAPSFCGVQHVHYSIWRITDDVNMSKINEDEDIQEFNHACMHGLQSLAAEAPALFQSMENPQYHKRLVTQNCRNNMAFRQCDGHWEFRRMPGLPFDIGNLHMVRDIAIILAGNAVEMKIPGLKDAKPSRNLFWKKTPVVENRLGYGNSGILSALNACIIGKNGFLLPDLKVLTSNLPLMIDENGEYKTS